MLSPETAVINKRNASGRVTKSFIGELRSLQGMLAIGKWKLHARLFQTGPKDSQRHLDRFHSVIAAANWFAIVADRCEPILNYTSVGMAKRPLFCTPIYRGIVFEWPPLLGATICGSLPRFEHIERGHHTGEHTNNPFSPDKM